MPRIVAVEVLRGATRPWTFYALYATDDLRYVASRRTPTDLGWNFGQQRGDKDGAKVAFVGLMRTRGPSTGGFLTVTPCELRVVEAGDLTYGEPEVVRVEVEDA